MKTKYRYISVRNMLIAALVFVVGIAASELYLKWSSVRSAADNMTEDENTKLQLMQMEKIPEKDLNSVEYIADYLRSLDPDAVPDTAPTYPLITDLMPDEESYEEDTMNIVVIADSFGWGACSTNRNELFWRLLENDLRQEGFRCRVYGVCYPGASSFDELSWLKESTLVEDLDPDMVIFGFVQNDMISGDGKEVLRETGKENVTVLDTSNSPFVTPLMQKLLPNVSLRLSNYLTSKRLENNAVPGDEIYITADNFPAAAYLKGAVLEKYERDFLKPLDDFAGEAGFPVVIMTLPPYPDNVLQKALFAPLEEAMKSYPNVAFYNSLPDFHHHYAALRHRNNYFVNSADFHPGSATHRFYADCIERFLKRDYGTILEKYRIGTPCETPFFINEWLPYKIDLVKVEETPETLTYTLRYPAANRAYKHFITFDNYFLNAPLGKNHIKLSFSVPERITSVKVSGEKNEEIELYFGKVDEGLNYDDHSVISCGEKKEGGVLWVNEKEERITSLYIHCGEEAIGGDTLTVTIGK